MILHHHCENQQLLKVLEQYVVFYRKKKEWKQEVDIWAIFTFYSYLHSHFMYLPYGPGSYK